MLRSTEVTSPWDTEGWVAPSLQTLGCDVCPRLYLRDPNYEQASLYWVLLGPLKTQSSAGSTTGTRRCPYTIPSRLMGVFSSAFGPHHYHPLPTLTGLPAPTWVTVTEVS